MNFVSSWSISPKSRPASTTFFLVFTGLVLVVDRLQKHFVRSCNQENYYLRRADYSKISVNFEIQTHRITDSSGIRAKLELILG